MYNFTMRMFQQRERYLIQLPTVRMEVSSENRSCGRLRNESDAALGMQKDSARRRRTENAVAVKGIVRSAYRSPHLLPRAGHAPNRGIEIRNAGLRLIFGLTRLTLNSKVANPCSPKNLREFVPSKHVSKEFLWT